MLVDNKIPYTDSALLEVLKNTFDSDNKLKIVGVLSFLLVDSLYDSNLWDYINSELVKNKSFFQYRYMPTIMPTNLPSEKIFKFQELIAPSNIDEFEDLPINKRPIGALNPFAFDFKPYSYEHILEEVVSVMEKNSLESALHSPIKASLNTPTKV